MYVLKRDGSKENVQFDKITERLSKLVFNLDDKFVDPVHVAQQIVHNIHPGITTKEIDDYAAEAAAGLLTEHPDYGILAGRILTSNLQKSTEKTFSGAMLKLSNRLAPRVLQFTQNFADVLNAAIIHARDFDYDYFGARTLISGDYLLRDEFKVTQETIQYAIMRASCGIHAWFYDPQDPGTYNLDDIFEMYELVSRRLMSMATPTWLNAGTVMNQMSSCYLLVMEEDSIEGIYNTLKECALISKTAGGIGFSISNIRSAGSYIKGTGGISNGIVPMLRNFNECAKYVDQGGGKRRGAFATYLEPWHPEILAFLDLKKNQGLEHERCRDLFYGLWIPDLFMERVEQDGPWALLDPHECPGLYDSWGETFNARYKAYEATSGKARKIVRAREVWKHIIEAQRETGTPYMLFKDACNRHSNQQNLGTIRCSNLCTEIIEFSDSKNTAVCNLASTALADLLVKEDGKWVMDWKLFRRVIRCEVRFLNKIIDANYSASKKADYCNKRTRPMGLGVQALANFFAKLRIAFTSEEARKWNKKIFAAIYFFALEQSAELARVDGPYEVYQGSPLSKGIFHWNSWGIKEEEVETVDGLLDWDYLQNLIHDCGGVRNSLFVAPMPTASTSQILGNQECFESWSSLLYMRRTLPGEFIVVCGQLVRELVDLGLWGPKMKDKIIDGKGSIQHIEEIPAWLKEIYLIVWEISQKDIVEMAAERSPYIDQSHSLNIHMTNPTDAKITSLHFRAWKLGLKTGLYYLRTRAGVEAIAGLGNKSNKKEEEKKEIAEVKVEKYSLPTGSAPSMPHNMSPETKKKWKEARQKQIEIEDAAQRALNAGSCESGSCGA